MKIPGVAWTILLVFLPLAAGYVTQFFGSYEWAGAVAGFLTLLAVGIAKVMSESKATVPAPPPGAELSQGVTSGAAQRSLAERIFFG